ncbi:hypothetical protein ACWDWV_05175 [Streptosporangium sandarakinum]
MTLPVKTTARLAALVSFSLVVGLPGPAAANDLTDMCAGPIAEMKRLNGLIKNHNAKPRASTDRAYVTAYNAEARSLNAQMSQAFSRARQCISAFSQVLRNHPLAKFPKPKPDQISTVAAAVKKLTKAEKRAVTRWNPELYDFFSYGPGKKGMTRRVDRIPPAKLPSATALSGTPSPGTLSQIYEALDHTRPDRNQVPVTSLLQGKLPPTVGKPDPAYAKTRNVTGVAYDHIIPLRRLVAMRNFINLTPENMWRVANSPANTQWLSKTANGSKLSGSSFFISGADPIWRQDQAELREKAMREVQALIDALLKSQKG